ncbi:MAG: metallophosphoesterase [Clostridia bacterium]|nr:metallophosphoesterase [Clostridia bacterium]
MMRNPLTVTVLTDTHYYCKKNGTSGKAYDIANSKSQKLLADSGEVLESAFNQIAADKESDIVLISGDLTNNGEMNAHAEFIDMLRKLKSNGKRVYVITATHDFRKNEIADLYFGDEKLQTKAASRDVLFDMYREFGPDEAISVHRESMSYIVQLCDGYRLFALNDDTNRNGKSGFSDECFEWITERAKEARTDNQFIIAMTHHPLIAPSPIYEIIGRGDMLGDYKTRIEQLADIGVQFIFTGHTHIPDTSVYQSKKGNVLYDICTSSPIGYPGAMRKVTFEPNKNNVSVKTVFVNTPECYKEQGLELKEVLEEQLIGVIKGMIKTAGEDIDRLADMVTAISIKPKVIYKSGWIIKPVFKFLNSLKVGTVAKWTKKETGLKTDEYADVKNRKVVDVVSKLVLSLFGGESNYPPDTAIYKIVIGFLNIVDSILGILHVDLKKITKVSSSAAELVEPLLYNSGIDSYNSELEIYPYIESLNQKFRKIEFKPIQSTVKKSKKGLPILIITALILTIFAPLWLLILLFGFVSNQIKYKDKIR